MIHAVVSHQGLLGITPGALQAARRRAIGELIFFAGVNDKHRCKRIVDAWRIKLDAEETCADYDRRTPLCAPLASRNMHAFVYHGSWTKASP